MQKVVSDLFDLSGHVALCTGGSSGIGLRMAHALSLGGADVVLVGRNHNALAQATEQIQTASNARVANIAADLFDRSILGDLVEQASAIFGAPDILVNAAGINLREPYAEISEQSWDQTLGINLATPFFLARHCIPGMQQKAYGKIINVASLQSYRAFANSIAYGASKGGITQLTRAMGRGLV